MKERKLDNYLATFQPVRHTPRDCLYPGRVYSTPSREVYNSITSVTRDQLGGTHFSIGGNIEEDADG